MHSYKSTDFVEFLSKSLDFPRISWYNVITVKNERGNANEGKAANLLTEISSNLDTVLNILAKLALVSMSIKTIIEIWTK